MRFRVVEIPISDYVKKSISKYKTENWIPFVLRAETKNPDYSPYDSDIVSEKYNAFVSEYHTFIKSKVDLILSLVNSNEYKSILGRQYGPKIITEAHNAIKSLVSSLNITVSYYYADMISKVKEGEAVLKNTEEFINDLNNNLLPSNF